MPKGQARRFIVAVLDEISGKNLTLIAAGVAFYAMLALFPGLAAMIAIWSLLADPQVLIDQLSLLDRFMPADVMRLIEAQILSLTSTKGETLGWAGVLSTFVAIWSARSGVASLIIGLNAIHGQENRGSLRHYLIALMVTLALMGVGVVTLMSLVILPFALSFVPLGPITALLIGGFRWAAAIFVLLAGLAVVYRFGPNTVGDRMKWVTPGAGLAITLWGIASYGFSIYLGNFGDYNEVYGSIGAAIAMLVWLYISAFLILFGAVVNLQLARFRPYVLASDP